MNKGSLIILLCVLLSLGNAPPGGAEVATFTGAVKYAAGSFPKPGGLYRDASGTGDGSAGTAAAVPKQRAAGQPGGGKAAAEADKTDWLARGIGLENQGRLHEAVEAYSKSIAGSSGASPAYLHRARVNGMLGRCRQAVEDYSAVIEKMPKHAPAYMGRGDAYECEGRGEEAIRDYSRAAELTPLDAEPFYRRALAWEALRRYGQAVSDFSRSISINPNRAVAYFKRGMAYSMLNQEGRAVEDYSRAIEMGLDLPTVYVSRGDAHSRLGNYDRALGDYEKAAVLHHDKKALQIKMEKCRVALRGRHPSLPGAVAVSEGSGLASSDPVSNGYGKTERSGVGETNKSLHKEETAGHRSHDQSGGRRNGNDRQPVFYTVQVLSSANRRGLDAGISLLEKEGFDDIRIVRNGKRYALRVEKFGERGEAVSALARVRKIYARAVVKPVKDGRESVVFEPLRVRHPVALAMSGKMHDRDGVSAVTDGQPYQEDTQSIPNYFQDIGEWYSSGQRVLPGSEPESILPEQTPDGMNGIRLVSFPYEDEAEGSRQTAGWSYIEFLTDSRDDEHADRKAGVHDAPVLLSQSAGQEELPAAGRSEKDISPPAPVRSDAKAPEAADDDAGSIRQGKENTAGEKQRADQPVPAGTAENPQEAAGADQYRHEDSKATVAFRGIVIDSFAKPLVGASIELTNMTLIRTVSGAGGAFTLEGVPEGNKFLLKVEMEGFLTSYVSGFQYPADAKAPHWITMYRVPGSVPADQTQKKPVNIEADTMSYERDKDTYHARGNVIITHAGDPGGVMTSDEALLNKAANEAESSGNVVARSGKDVIYGDRMVMDIETKKGSVYNGRMFMSKNHFYIKGDRIMKTGEASYFVENATATTCDGDSPDWRIRSSELDITIDGYGTAKHGRFEAKGIPVAYSPYFVFPVKTTRQSGLLFPYMSYSRDKLGWDVEVPFYWAISKSMDATFYQRYMSERGLKEGMEFRYAMSPNHYGTFYADFLSDRKKISEKMGNITRDWDGGQKRWSLYFNHISNFSPTFYLRSDIAKVSDNWYFKDFSSHNYYLSNYAKTDAEKFRKISFVGDETINSLTSTVRMVKNWKLYNLTGVMRYTDDFTQQKNDATLQQYPEITLTGMKQPLFKTPVNYELTSMYSYNYRVEGQRGQLFDIKPDFTLPLNLGRYAQLTPKVGWKGTVWDRDDKQEDPGRRRGTRQMFNMGAILNTEIQRIFNVGIGSVEKIRHSIKPELTYNYIPYVEQADIPNYVARVYDQNALIYALTNTLTARLKDKSGKVSYRELMRLKLAQLYDFKESGRNVTSVDRDSRPFSFIDAELDINPFQYLTFSARNKYSVNSGEWRQANYDVILRDWRGDMINLGYRYTYNKNWGLPDIYNTQGLYARELYTQDPATRDALKEITLSLKAVINENWEATYFQRRNENISTDTERTFGLNYRRQCWSIKVSYSDKLSYDAYGVEKPDRVFTLLLSFYGLGGVGTN